MDDVSVGDRMEIVDGPSALIGAVVTVIPSGGTVASDDVTVRLPDGRNVIMRKHQLRHITPQRAQSRPPVLSIRTTPPNTALSGTKSIQDIQPFAESIRIAQQQIEQFSDSMRLSKEIERSILSMHDFLRESKKNFGMHSEAISALAAAMKPIHIDFGSFSPNLGAIDVAMRDAFARLNETFVSARFIGQISLRELRDDKPDEALSQEAEAQLLDIVPAEALNRLRQVEFAPLAVLDRTLRNPELMRRFGSREFEGFVASLIEQIGFEDVILTPASRDGGRDVLATKRVHGIRIFCAFECKRYAPDRPVGPLFARALLGTLTHRDSRATKGVLVTTSSFTPAARNFILSEPLLDGKDFDGIVSWLHEYSPKTHSKP